MRVLSLNLGSSSLKIAGFRSGEEEAVMSGEISGIGRPKGTWRVDAEKGTRTFADVHEAIALAFQWLERAEVEPEGVGHRIVHGGVARDRHEVITPAFVADLGAARFLAPNHTGSQLAGIEAAQRRFPAARHVACLDTAFHREMPEIARLLPLPRSCREMGVRRFGFHGISYEYLMSELRRTAGEAVAGARVVLAHLGNGASMAAVRGGKCADTTMGFTPAAGLMMSARTGDIDPGIVRFVLRQEGMTAEKFDHLINRESGLLGVSETSSDVRDLLAAEAADPRAAAALGLFCHCARKAVGAMAASMGGLDTLVFSGGIGENAAPIRERICEGLDFLWGGRARDVRVIRTNEERQMARIVRGI